MDSDKFKQLLHRYLNGMASDAEKEVIDAWYDSYRELEDPEVFGSNGDESRIASQMRQRLSGYWNPPRPLGLPNYLSYAAAILVLVVIGWLVYRVQDNDGAIDHRQAAAATDAAYYEVATAVRQVKKLILPDSSTVWVNASSRLRVPESFGKTSRELYLDEGEAFFEVTPNLDKPFVVYSRDIVTKVLGTAFNISNYQRLNQITVDVQHGKVRITDTNQQLLVNELTATQQLAYNTRTGDHEVSALTTGSASAWREGVVRLRNATFEEVALAVYNIYGIDLKAGNSQIHDHRYNLTIRTEHQLDEALRIICSIHQNQYRRENNEVIIY